MALIRCPDCGKQISSQAASCIACGRPIHADLANKPAPGSVNATETGVKRAKWKHDLGNAIGFIGVCIGVVVMMAAGFLPGIFTMLIIVAVGLWVAYFS